MDSSDESPADDVRDQFRSLVNAVEEYAIFRLDADGRVVTWNEGAARIKGYDREEILNRHVSTFYTDEDRAAGVPERDLRDARESGTVEDEGWRVRADGTRFRANVTIIALHDEGEGGGSDEGTLRGYLKITRDLTERREREEQLRRERDLNEQLLEATAASIVLIDSDGRVVRANERAHDRLGFESVEEGYEVGDTDVYDEDGNPIPRDERPYVNVFETGEPVREWHCQIDLPRGRRWISINAVPLRLDGGERTPGPDSGTSSSQRADGDAVDHVLITAQDVTQLKEQARQLQLQRDELEAELDEMFARVTDAFVALDDDWVITYLNDRAAELLGREGTELVGTSVHEEFGQLDVAFREPLERAMDSQEVVSFEARSSELGAWFEVRAYPSETGLSVYFRDVTERKRREKALARQTERLDSFSSMLAHELRNPLQIAQLYLDATADGDPEAREEVASALDRISDMVEVLLVLARGDEALTRSEQVDLEAVAEAAWESVAPESASLALDATPTLAGETSHLRHLFENLFRNAIEHGGDEVTVRVGTLAEGRGFYVADDGPGIPVADRDRVFDAGYSTADGIGLGLTFVAQLADAYGWDCRVTESRDGGALLEFSGVDWHDED